METTFMTIHNLTPEANILYASDSISEILGYQPYEVANRSCFDYFHPDEVPFARGVHHRGVKMDKAAVLHYARIRGRDGQWVCCECVFTVVYDVLVACTSTYRRGGEANERRAEQAPAIRRLFASSPKDPRYHMLEHLSAKFRAPPNPELREPRAALILNRFTRTLTVMHATNAVSCILGVSADQFKGKSFYECIQENSLPDAIRCLESAKANDSIAYLRFWYRDPRRPEDIAEEDEAMAEASQSDSEDGGVELHGHDPIDVDANPVGRGDSSNHSGQDGSGQETTGSDRAIRSSSNSVRQPNSRASFGESDMEHKSANTIFDPPPGSRSSSSSILATPEQRRQARAASVSQRRVLAAVAAPYEIEAVVSCTSDGLVVVLRRARPEIPEVIQPRAPAQPPNANGLFAAPWGANPIRPHVYQPNPQQPFHHDLKAPLNPAGGPALEYFMTSIREVAVFAWSLTGINGNIASYGHGVPRGEAQPPAGLPVWDPYAQPAPDCYPPENQAAANWAQRDAKMAQPSNYPNQDSYPRMHGGYVYQGPGNYVNNGYANQYSRLQAPLGNVNPPPATSAPGPNEGNTNPWQ